jgi:hypothetical protein
VSATKGFYGSVVDMTIVKFDSAMVSMRNGVYSEYEYLLYDAEHFPLRIFCSHTSRRETTARSLLSECASTFL